MAKPYYRGVPSGSTSRHLAVFALPYLQQTCEKYSFFPFPNISGDRHLVLLEVGSVIIPRVSAYALAVPCILQVAWYFVHPFLKLKLTLDIWNTTVPKKLNIVLDATAFSSKRCVGEERRKP